MTAFELKQYEGLAKEIETDIAENRSLERLVLAGTGVVWTWLATVSAGKGFDFVQNHPSVWMIPGLFALLGGIRCLSLRRFIKIRAAYIRKMETATTKTVNLPGWETYLEKIEGQHKEIWSSGGLLIWLSLFVMSVVVARIQKWLPQIIDWQFWGGFCIMGLGFWAYHKHLINKVEEAIK